MVPHQIQSTLGFHNYSGVGGGDFVWLPDADQSLHLHPGPNGGILFAAAAFDVYDGTVATVLEFLNWKGIGVGCFERVGFKVPHVLMFGAVADYDNKKKKGTDNSVAFNKMLQNFPVCECRGQYNFLVNDTIQPLRKFTLNAEGATICQRTKNKPLFNLNGCSGSRLNYGAYTNDASIEEYDIGNARLIYADEHVTDITIYSVSIYRTFQQGINFNKSSERINVLLCRIEETARDGIFLLNSVNSRVSLCTLINTGDDSIAFAGNSYSAVASFNSIKGAGSYNLGGSGIRLNRSGIAVGNVIENSDLFGIIAADNSVNSAARPENLKIICNTINDISKTDTVSAGIGFKNVISVECVGNSINMIDEKAHAYRLYGDIKSGLIRISGGTVKNAKSVLYIRDAGVSQISISEIEADKLTDFVLAELTGTIDLIEIKRNASKNAENSCYFRSVRVLNQGVANISVIVTENNRIFNSNAPAFVFDNETIINVVESTNDQWPNNVRNKYINGLNVGEIYVN
ncbi:hypothetical protein [Rheinheimera sp. 1928-s]|uniref:hypothetical protein n=1 Tax=Rheinheimera sp. 1928-s TaxID=3033803 RepID=UPI00260AE22E|nr:hypothetical protein [Rheinheimera sp. 1928-s]MDF3125695.1 hypothetical protein [Rheinheimera sp. 1928-s]